MKFLHKFAAIFAASALVIAGASPFLNMVRAADPLAVTAADLTAAGFHDVQVQAPQGSAFQAPNMYFRTRESVATTHPEWGAAGNLVAVLIVSGPSDWTYNNGNPKVDDLSGRTRIQVSRPGYYIVVTGPDANAVTALSTLLQKK